MLLATLRGPSQRTTGGLLLWGVASLLSVLTFASPSLASPAFPNAVREAANMSCTPSCTVCHTVDPGVSGTATKSFAMAMRAAKLFAGILILSPLRMLHFRPRSTAIPMASRTSWSWKTRPICLPILTMPTLLPEMVPRFAQVRFSTVVVLRLPRPRSPSLGRHGFSSWLSGAASPGVCCVGTMSRDRTAADEAELR